MIRAWLIVGCMVWGGFGALSTASAQAVAVPALPSVLFSEPEDIEEGDADFGWMTRPDRHPQLARESLDLSEASGRRIRRDPLYWDAWPVVDAQLFAGALDFAQPGLIGDTRYEVRAGLLWERGASKPLFQTDGLTPYHTVTLNDWAASPSGRYIAAAFFDGGSEHGQVVVFDRYQSRVLDDRIGPIIGEGSFVWLDDSALAIRTPQPATDPLLDPNQGTRFHVYTLGVGVSETPFFGAGTPAITSDPRYWPSVWSDAASTPYLISYLWRGNALTLHLAVRDGILAGEADWQAVLTDKHIIDAEMLGEALYYIAAGVDGTQPLRRLDLATGADELVLSAEGGLAFEYSFAVGNGVYALARHGAVHRLFFIDAVTGAREVALPVVGAVDVYDVQRVARRSGEITLTMSSLNKPTHFVHLNGAEIVTAERADGAEGAGAAAPTVIHHETALSADGTRVPMTILAQATERADDDAPQASPSLILVYGSYGEVLMARRNHEASAWVAMGGNFSLCHVRGGGYWGPDWHEAGQGPDKSAAHADLIACAEHLITTGRAEGGRVGVSGASAGALVAGPAAYQRPDIIAGVILDVGDVNPLRQLDGPNGAAQIDEIGNPDDPADAALMRHSDSVSLALEAGDHPPVFLCVGLRDPRVPFWMSTRLAAVMASRDENAQIGFYAHPEAGHECGFDRVTAVDALVQKFVWMRRQLGR